MPFRRAASRLALVALLALPGIARGQEGPMPAGHPPVGGDNPHAHGGGESSMPGVFEAPPDAETPDPSLPPGTIEVDLRDADDKPVPRETVTLGVLINSIAKGDTRQHLQRTTDDQGRVVFSNLELASNIAYRVSCGYQGGLYAATPFQLSQARSMRVVLHVYAVTRDIQQALIVAEVSIASEMREDRVQVEEAMTFYNLGRTAWQPDGVTMRLPEGYTAFNAQASMSDQGVEEAGGGLASLHGTYPPGKSAVQFRWQVPWSEEPNIDFDVALPPHVAIARVLMPAAAGVHLTASGFPPADVRHDTQGQSFLVTERRLRPDEPKLTTISVGIHDLPTPGPGRLIALLIAGCGVGLGLAFAFGYASKPSSTKTVAKGRRTALLEELADLERARTVGEVGPKTYERARRQLIDSLSRTLAAG
jgi:hypothetical protein